MNNKETKKTKKTALGYFAGSIAICTIAVVIITEFMPLVTGLLNKVFTKISNRRHDDPGPVIEKK